MKKALALLQRFDHIWSIPLSILILIGTNAFAAKYFNDPLISTEYLSPLFYTACVITFLHSIVFFGMWLNHKFLLKTYVDDDNLTKGFLVREKVFLYLVVYAFYFIVSLIVFFTTCNLWFK